MTEAIHRLEVVFPTRVGMNRSSNNMRVLFIGVPHARGDEPAAVSKDCGSSLCSPRAWG